MIDTLQSVQYQTYKNLEIIVVDDGSTDNTYQKLEVLGDQIKLIRQENSGVSAARNKGIKNSSGEILMFLDSDDLWFPEKVEKQVELLELLDKSIVCCWCDIILRQSNGTEGSALQEKNIDPKISCGVWENPLEFYSLRFLLLNQSIAIRRSAISKIQGYNESLWIHEDLDFALQLSILGPWGFLKEPLAIWHADSENSLTKMAYEKSVKMYECKQKVYRKFLNDTKIKSRYVKFLLRYQYIRSKLKYLSAKWSLENKIINKTLAILISLPFNIMDRILKRSPLFPTMKVTPLETTLDRKN